LESENSTFKQRNISNELKLIALEERVKKEALQNHVERQLLTKHLSEKTKLYEITKTKLDNILGNFGALQNKQQKVIKVNICNLQIKTRGLTIDYEN